VDIAPSQINAKPYHRFRVGQTVVATSEGRDLHMPRGPWAVVRLLPVADGETSRRRGASPYDAGLSATAGGPNRVGQGSVLLGSVLLVWKCALQYYQLLYPDGYAPGWRRKVAIP
jgi:hypothetical protein